MKGKLQTPGFELKYLLVDNFVLYFLYTRCLRETKRISIAHQLSNTGSRKEFCEDYCTLYTLCDTRVGLFSKPRAHDYIVWILFHYYVINSRI